MTKRNERTSAERAKIASKVLRIAKGLKIPDGAELSYWDSRRDLLRHLDLTWGEVEALGGTALTQTADRVVRKSRTTAKRKRKLTASYATKRLRPYTVDASTIPELGETFDKPKRKTKRKPKFIARKIALRHKRDSKGFSA